MLARKTLGPGTFQAAALLSALLLNTASAQENAKERAHDAGVVEGYVSSVDRAHGFMTLHSRHGDYAVIVLPSTTIHSKGNDFHTIADIHRDQLVDVFMSRRGKTYFAQIIQLHTKH